MLLMLLVAALARRRAAATTTTTTASGGGDATDRRRAGGRPRSRRTPHNSATKLTIGSKNFTEQKMLGEIYAQALAAAGYTVNKELNLGDEKTALKALEGGEISAYPEYTGTALLLVLRRHRRRDSRRTSTQAYEQAKAELRQEGAHGARRRRRSRARTRSA